MGVISSTKICDFFGVQCDSAAPCSIALIFGAWDLRISLVMRHPYIILKPVAYLWAIQQFNKFWKKKSLNDLLNGAVLWAKSVSIQ